MKMIRCNRGQGLTEYMILFVLIAVASIVAAQSLGNTIKQKIQTARQKVNSGIIFND